MIFFWSFRTIQYRIKRNNGGFLFQILLLLGVCAAAHPLQGHLRKKHALSPRLKPFVKSRRDASNSIEIECRYGLQLNHDGSCGKPVVTRNIFAFIAPDVDQAIAPPSSIPDPRVELNIVFVKAPSAQKIAEPLVVPPPQQKTLIYVLSKNQVVDQEIIEVPSNEPSEPEVFFINYNPGENPTLPGGIDLETALSHASNQGAGSFLNTGSGYSAPQLESVFSTPQFGSAFAAPQLGYGAPSLSYDDSNSGFSTNENTYVVPQSLFKRKSSEQVDDIPSIGVPISSAYLPPQPNDLSSQEPRGEEPIDESMMMMMTQITKLSGEFIPRPNQDHNSFRTNLPNLSAVEIPGVVSVGSTRDAEEEVEAKAEAIVESESVLEPLPEIKLEAAVLTPAIREPLPSHFIQARSPAAGKPASLQPLSSFPLGSQSDDVLTPIRLTGIKLKGGSTRSRKHRSSFFHDDSPQFPSIGNFYYGN